MAKKHQPAIAKNHWIIMSVLAVGVVAGVWALQSSTGYRQYADVTNLNTSSANLITKNPDGTMGPATEIENLSTNLTGPKSNITIKVGSMPSPTGVVKGNGRNKAKNQTNAQIDQELTSLVLTVSKVEVHLAQLNPPQNITALPTGINGIVPSPNSNPKGNQQKVTGADKWETIEIDGETVDIDLVQLAQTNIAETLGLAALACGKYTEIRLYVTAATATFANDETSVPVEIPGKSGIVRIVRPFTIAPSETASEIRIDFDAQKSIVKTGNRYLLKPVVARIQKI